MLGLGCWDTLAGLAEDRKHSRREKGPSRLGDQGQRPETGHMLQWDRKGLSPFGLHLMGEPLNLPLPCQGKGTQESPVPEWGVGLAVAVAGVGSRKVEGLCRSAPTSCGGVRGKLGPRGHSASAPALSPLGSWVNQGTSHTYRLRGNQEQF